MDVHLVKIWASPSTLHLRVMVSGKHNSWAKFHEIHVPLAELNVGELAAILHSESERLDGEHEPRLF